MLTSALATEDVECYLIGELPRKKEGTVTWALQPGVYSPPTGRSHGLGELGSHVRFPMRLRDERRSVCCVQLSGQVSVRSSSALPAYASIAVAILPHRLSTYPVLEENRAERRSL